MYPIEVQQRLNELAQKYAPLFRNSVVAAFNDPKKRTTGELAGSVKATVTPATADTTPQITLHYEDYGDFIGTRRLIFTKQPPVDKLQQWIADKGSKFRRKAIPGYANGSTPNISIDEQNKRIAFAISRSLKFRQRFTRRYLWKKASLPTVLSPLNDELVRAWTSETEKLIAQSLTTHGKS